MSKGDKVLKLKEETSGRARTQKGNASSSGQHGGCEKIKEMIIRR